MVLSLNGKHESLNCELPHETLIVKIKGWGLARCLALDACRYDFVVMINGDVEVKAELWPYLLTCKRGEFFMTNYNGGACSRVFAGFITDIQKVGFDSSLKFIFEDGDFYVRALTNGLRFRVVPSNLYSHHEHFHSFLYNMPNSFFVDWEFSRVFAKYKFFVRRDLYNFFLQPWCIRRIPNMVVRVFATCFWIMRGWLN